MASRTHDADPMADWKVGVRVDDAVLSRTARCRVSEIGAQAEGLVDGYRMRYPGRYVSLEEIRRIGG